MPSRAKMTHSGLLFASRWIEDKYWSGIPLLKAVQIVKGHLGMNDPIGDLLEDRRWKAHAAELRANEILRIAGEALLASQRQIMVDDIERRQTYQSSVELIKSESRVSRLRCEYRSAQRAHVLATRQWAAWCQGMVCNG